MRTFLARAAVDVAEFSKKAEGTVHATERLDQEQEWLCTRCSKWFSFASGLRRPSEYSSQQGPDEKLGRGLAVPIRRTEFHSRERLRRHLRRGARRCVQAVRDGELPTLRAEEVERLDAADAVQRRRARQGISRLVGPPCCPAQRLASDASPDDCSDASSDASFTSDCAGRP